MSSIKAVIYDMDGVLINSEPLWREAIITTFKKVGLHFTEKMCQQTMGMRLYEVIEYWHHKTPWEGMTLKEVESDLLKTVTQLILDKGEALPGVNESIQYFQNKGYKIALASSSANSLIEAVLTKLNLNGVFSIVNSAEHLTHGKPHPEIFIKTALEMGVNPVNCLVIEDSFNGVLAGKAAMMNVIAIPEEENWNDERFCIANYNLKSLNEITALEFE